MLFCCVVFYLFMFCFFFTHTATTEIYTLSLHDALPISGVRPRARVEDVAVCAPLLNELELDFSLDGLTRKYLGRPKRSEEHTSELQSLRHLVCRLLLEKKKKKKMIITH